jgi:hypothetical protein
MSISELFQYRNDSFQSDIFSSDIVITDVDVGRQISPTLRSMSMPTGSDFSVIISVLSKKCKKSKDFITKQANITRSFP